MPMSVGCLSWKHTGRFLLQDLMKEWHHPTSLHWVSSAYSIAVVSCIWDYYRLKRWGEKHLHFCFSSPNCSRCVLDTTLGLIVQMAWKGRLHWFSRWLLSGPSQGPVGVGPKALPSTGALSRPQHWLSPLSSCFVSHWVSALLFCSPEREGSNLVSLIYWSSNVCPLVPSEWTNSYTFLWSW